jgi:1-acyl-sn-glycerol-3-phosphate acyltransferase
MDWAVRHLRAIARALAWCGVTTFFSLLWASLMPGLLVFAKASYRWSSFNFRGWSKATAALLGMRVEVKGVPPRAPFFLVSNHLSYVDVVAFASQLECVFVAKSEVASWPVLGWLCRGMGTLFVDRHSRRDVLRVNGLIERALHRGKGVLLFPEGTSTAGVEVLPFHSALFEPAVRAGYPVSYATVSYRTPAGQPPAHQAVCWWGEMSFLPHLYRLFQVTAFEATLAFGSHSIRAKDRKTLATQLCQAVKEEPCRLTTHSFKKTSKSSSRGSNY